MNIWTYITDFFKRLGSTRTKTIDEPSWFPIMTALTGVLVYWRLLLGILWSALVTSPTKR